MTIGERAEAIARKARELGMGSYAAEQLRQFALAQLQAAYAAGDNHGMNNPHPGESMGR